MPQRTTDHFKSTTAVLFTARCYKQRLAVNVTNRVKWPIQTVGFLCTVLCALCVYCAMLAAVRYLCQQKFSLSLLLHALCCFNPVESRKSSTHAHTFRYTLCLCLFIFIFFLAFGSFAANIDLRLCVYPFFSLYSKTKSLNICTTLAKIGE